MILREHRRRLGLKKLISRGSFLFRSLLVTVEDSMRWPSTGGGPTTFFMRHSTAQSGIVQFTIIFYFSLGIFLTMKTGLILNLPTKRFNVNFS